MNPNEPCCRCHLESRQIFSSGRQSPYCKQCGIVRHSIYYKKNPHAARRRSKDHYNRNKREYLARNLKKRFGLTLEEYDKMCEQQKGLCYACKEPETSFSNAAKSDLHLSIDHDHRTGRVRKLLCSRCNKILGHAKDRIDILLHLIDYLREHSN